MKIDLNSEEFCFEIAWKHLLEGYVIASKTTMCAYWLAKDKESLKFYNPCCTIIQDCDYMLNKEMLGTWVIGELSNV